MYANSHRSSMTEKRCKTYKIKMKLQIKYVDLIHIIHITYSSGHGYYYYDQNQHAVSGSSAGHQFQSHIPHQIPQVHFPPQVIPPPQAHQRAHQVHQPLHNLNVLQYPNFSQINNTQSHFPVTSESSSYFNPTTSNPSPTSPVPSLSSPPTLPITPSYPMTSTPRRPLRYIHYSTVHYLIFHRHFLPVTFPQN